MPRTCAPDCQGIAGRGSRLQGASYKPWCLSETKKGSNLKQKFPFVPHSAVKTNRNPVLFFCLSLLFFFNSLGFYFVLEIWTIISFSVYTASDIALKKQYLKILATYPSAIFLRLGPCMSMFFCKLCLLQYSFIVCILSNTLERKCSKTFTQYKITISLVNC